MTNFKFDLVSVVIVLVVVGAALPLIFGGVSIDREGVTLSDNDRSTSSVQFDADTNPTIMRNIAANGSNVYIVWSNHTEGAVCAANNLCDIVFLRSTDNGTTFSNPIILGNTTSASPTPAIAVGSEGHVFVVWQNGTDILLSASSNSGLSFNIRNHTVISGVGEATRSPNPSATINIANPQILANKTGGNVYVAWTNVTTFKFVNSTDNFNTFSSMADIGTVGGSDQDVNTLKFAANKSHIFIVTQERHPDDNTVPILVFKASRNGTAQSFLDNGNKTIATLGGTTHHAFPSIVANSTGSEIYVAFRHNKDFNFTRSSDGTTFTIATTTEGNGIIGLDDLTQTFTANPFPEIALGEDGRVFVVWSANDENPDVIRIRVSTDEGLTFGDLITINPGCSATTCNLEVPRIASSNGSVYIVYTEVTTTSKDISLTTSSNNGRSFSSSKTVISQDTRNDKFPQIAAVNDKAYIIWESHVKDAADTNNGEINFTSVTGLPIDFFFNASDGSNFRVGEVVNMTVDDFQSSGTINVPIFSATDTDGITVELTEQGSTGNFTGTFSFSDSSTNDGSDILKVSPDDVITATHRTATGTTNIFPVDFTQPTFGFNSTSYNLGNAPTIQVKDQNSNLDSTTIETVIITVQSTEAGDSVSLTLTETGVDDGIFGVPSSDTSVFNLIFVNGTGTSTPVGRTLTISQESSDGITSTVNVTSTSDPDGLTNLSLTDSDGDGIFTGKITISSSSGSTSLAGRTIEATTCDFINFIVNEGDGTVDTRIITRRMVTPCEDVTKEPISVDVRIKLNGDTRQKDFLVATLRGVSSSATGAEIKADGTEGGVGGGGLTRASLVLDALAGASAGVFGGGGGGAPILNLKALRASTFMDMPDVIDEAIINFNPFIPLEPFDVTAEEFETFDFPFSIDNNGYAIAGYSNTLDTKTLNTGEATKIKTVFYMPFELEHVAFYTNIREGDSLDDSDAFLRFYQSKPDLFQIKDENGFFEYINLTIEEDGIKKTAIFDMKFKNPMPKSDIVLRMWDEDLHSTTVIIFDAIEVVGPSLEPIEEPAPEDLEIPEPGTTIPETSELRIEEPLTAVPDWIKTSARWWNDEQISDTGFARGIEFLIENNILKVPQTETFDQVQEIPGWIKNTAGWWSDGLLPDQDFVNGIQWLIKNGIMKIQINS